MRINRLLLVSSSMVFAAGCLFAQPKSDRQMANEQNAQYKKAFDTLGPVPEFAKKAIPDADAQVTIEDLSHKGLAASVPAGTPPPTFIKAYPLSPWGDLVINDGPSQGKSMDVAVFYKGGQSGWCRFERMSLEQKGYEGHYGPPQLIGFGGGWIGHAGKHVDCAEVDSLPAK